jgi:toxin FitB
LRTATKTRMYLIDTNVISEARKRGKANRGVRVFFHRVSSDRIPIYISVITVGELRRGIELIRHRGDRRQAERLETWLEALLIDYQDGILDMDQDIAQLWGRLRVPHPENALDKQVAATALIYDLTVVTRHQADFRQTGVRVLNPSFSKREQKGQEVFHGKQKRGPQLLIFWDEAIYAAKAGTW